MLAERDIRIEECQELRWTDANGEHVCRLERGHTGCCVCRCGDVKLVRRKVPC